MGTDKDLKEQNSLARLGILCNLQDVHTLIPGLSPRVGGEGLAALHPHFLAFLAGRSSGKLRKKPQEWHVLSLAM